MNKISYRIMLIVTVCAITVMCIKATEVKQIVTGLEEQIEQIEQEIWEEEQRLESLQKEREEIDSLAYIEKVAREKLGLVKEHDVVFKVK